MKRKIFNNFMLIIVILLFVSVLYIPDNKNFVIKNKEYKNSNVLENIVETGEVKMVNLLLI